MSLDPVHNEITLPDQWIDRCCELGERIVACYRNGHNEASRAFSLNGIELDPFAQAFARMGEVAFAVWANLNPETAVNWTDRPDNGHDVVFRNVRIDVKTIEHFKKYLLWPVTKNGIYLTKRFHVLVLVKGDLPHFRIERWIDKPAFYCEKHVADQTPGLIDGTWYMRESELWPISQFSEIFNRSFA